MWLKKTNINNIIWLAYHSLQIEYWYTKFKIINFHGFLMLNDNLIKVHASYFYVMSKIKSQINEQI